jgi:NADPH:quinone reductase-like Zn-dependent oxidoreductase
MKALWIEAHGPISNLHIREVPDPPRGGRELRVEIHAAGVNPSDIVSAEGRFPQARLPRVLGRDFAGRVVDGPRDWVGVDVWGSGGDLGITRNGTHAEQIVLPVDGAARRPANLSAERAAGSGLPFVTAWAALVNSGQLGAGEWVIVSGAAGAVGTAATEIAAALGGRVIALVKDEQEAARVDRTRVIAVARSDRGDLVDVVHDATGGRGAALALNGVGAAIFRPLVDALAKHGRMVVYSAASGRDVQFDLFELYRRSLEFAGIDTAMFDASACARMLDEIAPFLERGEIVPRQPMECVPLSEAKNAYERVAAGTPNKYVLIPHES